MLAHCGCIGVDALGRLGRPVLQEQVADHHQLTCTFPITRLDRLQNYVRDRVMYIIYLARTRHAPHGFICYAI